MFITTTRQDITLRPYQEEAIAAIEEAFKKHQSCLMVMATGLGKTVAATELMRRRKGRSVWVAHRLELVEQAADTIGRMTGVMPQVEMAERKADLTTFNSSNIVVGSVQTLNAQRQGRARMKRFAADHYSTLITDEAHHAVAKSWATVSEHFCSNSNLRHLGMTATPDRGDEEALGQIYDHCAYRYDIGDGVLDGWLVPILVQRIMVESIDLAGVGRVAGDLNQGELASVMEEEKTLHGVAQPLLSEAADKRTLIFTSSVKHAHRLAEILNRENPGCAEAIDGKTPKEERRMILQRYKAGDVQYLANVGIATEGFDMPDIDCVAIARPTMSRALYAQMLGRGTRPVANTVDNHADTGDRRQCIADSRKPNLLVMDFVGNSGKHKLVSPADVLGGNCTDRTIAEANRMASKSSTPQDVVSLLERAENVVATRLRKIKERDRRSGVRANVNYKSRKVDPFDVLDLEPPQSSGDWGVPKLSAGQMEWLERSGFETEFLSVREQRKILGELIRRRKKNLASPKQVALLKKYNYNTSGVTFTQASALIDRLAKNNWKRV